MSTPDSRTQEVQADEPDEGAVAPASSTWSSVPETHCRIRSGSSGSWAGWSPSSAGP